MARLSDWPSLPRPASSASCCPPVRRGVSRRLSRLSNGRAPARARPSLEARATRRKITHLRGARANQVHPLRPVLSQFFPSLHSPRLPHRKRLPWRMGAPTTQQSTPSRLHRNSVSPLSIPAHRFADVSASGFHFSLSFVL